MSKLQQARLVFTLEEREEITPYILRGALQIPQEEPGKWHSVVQGWVLVEQQSLDRGGLDLIAATIGELLRTLEEVVAQERNGTFKDKDVSFVFSKTEWPKAFLERVDRYKQREEKANE